MIDNCSGYEGHML